MSKTALRFAQGLTRDADQNSSQDEHAESHLASEALDNQRMVCRDKQVVSRQRTQSGSQQSGLQSAVAGRQYDGDNEGYERREVSGGTRHRQANKGDNSRGDYGERVRPNALSEGFAHSYNELPAR